MRKNNGIAREMWDHRTRIRKRLGIMISVAGWVLIMLLILGPLAFLAAGTLTGRGEGIEAFFGIVFDFEALICLVAPFIFLISCCFYMTQLGPEVSKGESRDKIAAVIIGLIIISGLCLMFALVMLATNPSSPLPYILMMIFLITGLAPLYMLYLLLVSWRSFNKTGKGPLNTIQNIEEVTRESELESKVKAEEYYMERWGSR